ncbi:MAG: hypothetical protein GTO40_24835 [Deltaproteobacteria bacterium]|nr:hypothetical protein [Deltaproteobacteria bacterium]
MMNRLKLIVTAGVFVFFAHLGFSQAADMSKAKAFYKGKTIIWMIGSTPGGSVDRLSRLVGPFLAKHMGAKIVLQNRPGGGGTFAFNYLYNKAKPDGLRLAFHIGSTQALNIVSSQPGIRFDLPKMSFIGVVSPTNLTLMAYKKRFKSLDDITRAKSFRYGFTRPGGNVHFNGVALTKILNLNTQYVSGYSGSSAVRQAILSGEVDVTLFPASSYVSAIKEGIVVPLLTVGHNRHPAVPDVPTLNEVVKEIPPPFNVWIDIGRVGWFLLAPPAVPEDRLEFLRVSLKKALEDPELLKKAKKQQFLIDYLEPKKAHQIVTDFLGMSQKDKDQLKKLLKGG